MEGAGDRATVAAGRRAGLRGLPGGSAPDGSARPAPAPAPRGVGEAGRGLGAFVATAAATMAENWKNCFEEELICPICLHVFVEPVQLPCKHNFCRGCIGEAWAKDSGLVRCPECNQAYNQKPGLEKNLKLTNIVEKFNALHVEKPAAALHCVFCRRGPPLPAQKVCLRCEAPCCQSHVQTHLQQPSTARGHLLVEADDVRAWSCPQHNAYRLYHCEAEQVAVCQYCCYYSGAHQGHSVCDVEIRRNEIRASTLAPRTPAPAHPRALALPLLVLAPTSLPHRLKPTLGTPVLTLFCSETWGVRGEGKPWEPRLDPFLHLYSSGPIL